MNYIDFNTRIFPDTIAKQAIEALAAGSGRQPRTDGTLRSLLASMDSAGISSSVVANIAGKPAEVLPILGFCKEIKSDRIRPLISFPPSSTPDEAEELFGEAQREGIRGICLSTARQNFRIDDKWMYGFYELATSCGLFVMLDIASSGNDKQHIDQIRKVANWFKDLTIVCAHAGAWKQPGLIDCLRGCGNVYIETSTALNEVSDDDFAGIISNFSEDRVLFGSNSPWMDQKEMLERTLRLRISDSLKEKMLYKNAATLLGLLTVSR